MMPSEPESPKFENILKLNADEREHLSRCIARDNTIEAIRKRLHRVYRAESLLPLANGILSDDILKHEVLNLSVLRQVELRAFRIKIGA